MCSVMLWSYLLLLDFTNTFGCRSSEDINKKKIPKYFTSGWGGWTPPNDSWKAWIEIYGKKNSLIAFDSTEVGRDPESGWPSYWKGMGYGNEGVPPPPWAYVPGHYDRPKFCYLYPAAGNCLEILSRWGFNPTSDSCQRFFYSGCGANENNFLNKYDCEQACGRVPDTGCSGKIDFRDYLEDIKLPEKEQIQEEEKEQEFEEEQG